MWPFKVLSLLGPKTEADKNPPKEAAKDKKVFNQIRFVCSLN